MSDIDRLSHKSYNSGKVLQMYRTKEGRVPFDEWLQSFRDRKTRARIQQYLDRLELGHKSDYKSVGEGILELRLHFGAGYRIYFVELDELVILLLCGGNKSRQDHDIKEAKRYWDDLKRRCYD